VEWIVVDRERVVGTFSTARRQLYAGWIAVNPEKVERVDELVANLVMEFRSGVEANPRNVLDPDPGKLPQSCVRYCEELCLFEICTEMGAVATDAEMQGAAKAEIFLRYMYAGRFFLTGGEGGGSCTPLYAGVVEHAARMVDG